MFYCDAGACFVRSIWPIINSIKQDVWCCDIPTIEEEFTKEECFAYMDCDSEQYRKTNQRIATFMCFKKTQDSVAFVKEWLKLCKTFQLISPAESIRYKDHILYSHSHMTYCCEQSCQMNMRHIDYGNQLLYL